MLHVLLILHVTELNHYNVGSDGGRGRTAGVTEASVATHLILRDFTLSWECVPGFKVVSALQDGARHQTMAACQLAWQRSDVWGPVSVMLIEVRWNKSLNS